MIGNPNCVECGVEMKGAHIHRKFCSPRCRGRWAKKHPYQPRSVGHKCRICGKHISIGPGQHNKWICSQGCRRASIAAAARIFRKRRPERQEIYRGRTRKKLGPDGNLRRFYIWNPNTNAKRSLIIEISSNFASEVSPSFLCAKERWYS